MEPTLKNTDFWIIDTKTYSNRYKGLDWEYVELTDNSQYAKLVEWENDYTLSEKHPRLDMRISGQATNYHTPLMMNTTEPRLKADKDGLIFIKDQETAKKVLTELQKNDKDIKLSKYGKQFDEANPKEIAKKAK